MSRTPTPPPNPACRRGDVVVVAERGITPWRGQVTAVKWSPVSGWSYEVERGDDGLTYVVPERYVDLIAGSVRRHRAEPKAEDGGPLTPMDEWAETEETGL